MMKKKGAENLDAEIPWEFDHDRVTIPIESKGLELIRRGLPGSRGAKHDIKEKVSKTISIGISRKFEQRPRGDLLSITLREPALTLIRISRKGSAEPLLVFKGGEFGNISQTEMGTRS